MKGSFLYHEDLRRFTARYDIGEAGFLKHASHGCDSDETDETDQ